MGSEWQLGAGDAADHEAAKLDRRHLVEPTAHLTDHVLANGRGADPSVEKPFSRFLKGERFAEQSAEIEDSDAALAQRVDEHVMFLACLLHPQHVVEEQRFAIVRGQSLKTKVRTVNHHFPELADFGIGAEPRLGCWRVHSGLMLPFQIR